MTNNNHRSNTFLLTSLFFVPKLIVTIKGRNSKMGVWLQLQPPFSSIFFFFLLLLSSSSSFPLFFSTVAPQGSSASSSSHDSNTHAAARFHSDHVTNGSVLIGRRQMGRCNLFRGRWMLDPFSSPVYDFTTCPFINPEFDCLRHGRPDRQYLKYTWKPDGCSLPRFNGKAFLRRYRGKKIMFVGDSLSLNQWNSLACMIHASVPGVKYRTTRRSLLYAVYFQEYDVSLLLYHTTYLVDLVRERVGVVLKLQSIRGGDAWKDMDVLIFNTWHWWIHTGKSQLWDYLEDGGKLYKDMNRLTAFYKGLTTWAHWVDRYVDPSRTKVFFQGISPTHYNGREWNAPSKSCSGQSGPLSGSTYPAGIPPEQEMVNKVISGIKKPVYLLDITTLSQLRKDAHPAAYGGDRPGTDCSHWCLPGLPDTWNQLLYTALIT